MQLALLIIVLSTYLGTDAAQWSPWIASWDAPVKLFVLGCAYAGMISAMAVAMRWHMADLRSRGAWSAIRQAERALSGLVWVSVGVHVASIVFIGWVDVIRGLTGDWWIVDDLLVMAPPLVTWLIGWTLYYPIHRYIRERALIGQLDRGEPVYAIPTRWRYAIMQMQMHAGIVLVPALLILGWIEAVELAWRQWIPESWPTWTAQAGVAAGVLFIIVLAPVILKKVWRTRPLGPGVLRDRLQELAATHRVRLADILVWETNGSLINGAVVGLFGKVRYVLLSDALLDALTHREIEAVMAHEVGHARRHHLPWLALSLLASLSIMGLTIEFAMSQLSTATTQATETQTLIAMVAATIAGLLIFGWISRRFERQADTFAAVHLSRSVAENDQSQDVTVDGALTMSVALGRVADLNAIDRNRRSWRHGSIAWRQKYLNQLIGKPVNQLPIDRMIRGIKIATLIALIGSLVAAWPLT